MSHFKSEDEMEYVEYTNMEIKATKPLLHANSLCCEKWKRSTKYIY